MNLVQAQLAKSLLDDYGIFCALWDENAHVIRAPFAIPVRLVVADGQAEAAILVLHNDVDSLARLSERESLGADTVQSIEQVAENKNPWELLAAAYYFFVPAFWFLQMDYPNFLASTSFTRYLIARVTVAHFFGWLSTAFAALLIVTYFYTRQAPHTDT